MVTIAGLNSEVKTWQALARSTNANGRAVAVDYQGFPADAKQGVLVAFGCSAPRAGDGWPIWRIPERCAAMPAPRTYVELITELEAIDKKIKTADTDLRELVVARGSTLLELHGVGPVGAARLLADVGNIHRFVNRDRFASWNGTAPLDASSGEQQRHRLSRVGSRRINRTLHIMGVVQLCNPPGSRLFRHQESRRQDVDGSDASAQTTSLERRLRPHAR